MMRSQEDRVTWLVCLLAAVPSYLLGGFPVALMAFLAAGSIMGITHGFWRARGDDE
jgi:hypothetical protein